MALILHLALMALLFAVSLRFSCRPRQPLVMPIDLVMASDIEEVAEVSPEPSPPVEPDPEPSPPVEPDPGPAPVEPEPAIPSRPRRTPVEVSRTRVVRRQAEQQPPAISPEEMRRLLAQETAPAGATAAPDSDRRDMIRVRNVLHAAWIQPPASETGARPVIVEVLLDRGGNIGDPRIVQSSGNETMDQSVVQAVIRAPVVPGLSPDFTRRYPRLRIEFRLGTR